MVLYHGNCYFYCEGEGQSDKDKVSVQLHIYTPDQLSGSLPAVHRNIT